MQCDFVFAYLRLSRDDKEKMEESNSIKNQRLLIQHFVENQPEFAGAKFFFFVDDGYSGTNFNKPDFQRMLEDIENGLIGIVIVKDMSRFGRNYILVGITGFSNVNVLYAFCYNNFEVSYKHLRKVILS